MAGACVQLRMAASMIFLALAVALVPDAVFAASDQHFSAARSAKHSDVLIISWRGRIDAPMSAEIDAAFRQYKSSVKGVLLKLDSEGGSVAEGERVIRVLQDIKKTHKLYTAVTAGRKCASMCVFIYVQGQKRLAASASLWLFHEVSYQDPKTHQVTRLDRASWERLIDKYWVPAGVDPKWIERVKMHTVGKDYWQPGEDLLQDHANIIQQALPDEQRRVVKAAPVCRKYSATADGMIEISCAGADNP